MKKIWDRYLVFYGFFVAFQVFIASSRSRVELLLVHQAETLIWVGVLGVMAAVLSRRGLRFLFGLLLICFLTVNEVYFDLFRENMSFLEFKGLGDISIEEIHTLWESLIFDFNKFRLVQAGAGFALWTGIHFFGFQLKPHIRKLVQVSLGAYVGANILGLLIPSPQMESPFTTLTRSSWMAFIHNEYEAEPPKIEDQLPAGDAHYPKADPKLIQSALEAKKVLNQRRIRPDVILMILESTGTKQLPHTPSIEQLRKHGIFFSNAMVPYPGTIRSHHHLLSGGYVVAQKNLYREFGRDYHGESLVQDFRESGYYTCFFSSSHLDFENHEQLIHQFPFDLVHSFSLIEPKARKLQALHSWGGKEMDTWHYAQECLENAKKAHQPFFLVFVTNSTHYPYWPVQGTNRERYSLALQHTDTVLGEMIAHQKGSPTLFLLTGDHGEAFGETHPFNLLHRNYLYDENMRSFFLFSETGLDLPAFEWNAPIATGDLRSILYEWGMASRIPRGFMRTFPDNYQPRPQFFFKNAGGIKLGLKDGDYKYISEWGSMRGAELYDLASDPDEVKNVLEMHSDLGREYQGRVERWFAHADDAYQRQLGSKIPEWGRVKRRQLPSFHTTGYFKNRAFYEVKTFLPDSDLLLYSRWSTSQQRVWMRVKLITPSGKEYFFKTEVPKNLGQTFIDLKSASQLKTLEAGLWTVTLSELNGVEKARDQFRVMAVP